MGRRDKRSRWLRAVSFAAGAVLDACVLPVSLANPRRRVARRVREALGISRRGALREDAGHVLLRRLHRRLAHRLTARGPDDLEGALDVEGRTRLDAARALGRGVLLVGTHGAPSNALSAALRLLGVDALHVRQARPPAWDPPVRTLVMEGEETADSLARTLLESLEELRRGGVVAFTLEGPFGRRRAPVRVQRVSTLASLGGAALARRSGAVALPVVVDVSRLGRVLVRFGAPIPREEGDEAASADERFVRNAAASLDALLADRAPSRRFERLYECARFSCASMHAKPPRRHAEATA